MADLAEPSDNPAGANRATREGWARRSEAWSRTAPGGLAPANAGTRRLIGAAGIAAGMRTVDLASGVGEPAVTIAVAVGEAGRVTATDFSFEMLSGARRRARKAELRNIDFTVADMQALPFRDGSFDALTCRCGLMFPDDPVMAASEARRVLKPGARAAFQVWGPLEGNPGYRATRYTVLPILGQDPDQPVARHRFAAAGSLAETLERAGFTDVEERDIIETGTRPATEPVWRSGLQRSFAHQLATLDPETRARIDSELKAAFAAFLDGDSYHIRTHARIGTAVAPG